jgi:hypothetical protein
MFTHKFKRGDKVLIKLSGVRGTINICYTQGSVNMYVVNLSNGLDSDYSENDIKFYDEKYLPTEQSLPVNIGDNCPTCKTPWKVTRFGANTWYDCIPCKKRAEQLISSSTSTYGPEDPNLFDYLDSIHLLGFDD